MTGLLIYIVIGYALGQILRAAVPMAMSAWSIHSAKKKAAVAPKMTFKEIADSTPVGIYACAVYSDRLFEQKLIDAGIETQLSKCDNDECENCYPVKKKALPTGPAPGARRRDLPDLKAGLNDTLRWRDANAYSITSKKEMQHKKEMAKREYEKSRSGRRRVAEVSGRMVPIPSGVPKFAKGVLHFDYMRNSSVMWEWTLGDEPGGKRMVWRQSMSPEMFEALPLAPQAPFRETPVCDDLCEDTAYWE